jgi:membrane protein implicated in regulation of membrane protease activity
MIFSVMMVFAVFSWRAYLKKHPLKSRLPNLNARGAQMVGKIGTVTVEIKNGQGRIQVGDSNWTASGPDLPVNVPVQIIGIDGVVLKVKKVG